MWRRYSQNSVSENKSGALPHTPLKGTRVGLCPTPHLRGFFEKNPLRIPKNFQKLILRKSSGAGAHIPRFAACAYQIARFTHSWHMQRGCHIVLWQPRFYLFVFLRLLFESEEVDAESAAQNHNYGDRCNPCPGVIYLKVDDRKGG